MTLISKNCARLRKVKPAPKQQNLEIDLKELKTVKARKSKHKTVKRKAEPKAEPKAVLEPVSEPVRAVDVPILTSALLMLKDVA